MLEYFIGFGLGILIGFVLGVFITFDRRWYETRNTNLYNMCWNYPNMYVFTDIHINNFTISFYL